jgi:hypothetical protein
LKSIEQVINENPELYQWGWRIDEWQNQQRGDMLSEGFREQVDRCLTFIRERCVQIGRSNRYQGSYGLKHLAENYQSRVYVSNGAFIVAALMLGYEARRFKGSPNCAFNLKVIGERA